MKRKEALSMILMGILILISTIFISCKKNTNGDNKVISQMGYITQYNSTDTNIKINQAVALFDSAAIMDSIDWIKPPTKNYYEWSVTPNNGCYTINGNKNLPIVKFQFLCAGIYRISANIYDSLSHELIGKTNTTQVYVSSDTLYPTQAIKLNDILMLRTNVTKTWNAPNHTSSPPDNIYVQLMYKTTATYNYFRYLQLQYKTNIDLNSYSYVFADSLRLISYPFAHGETSLFSAEGVIEFSGLTIGVPANLNITWLGKTYSGTLTLDKDFHLTTTWNNNGAVIIN